MQSNIQRTAAEEALVAAFGAAAGALPGDADLAHRRDDAIEAIKAAGLPTRRDEAWHYTDLRNLLRGFQPVATRVEAGVAGSEAGAYKRLADATRLPFFDGHYFASLADVVPDGVTVASFGDAVKNRADTSPWTAVEAAGAVGGLNTAFFRDGLAIKVAAGAKPEKPFGLANVALHDSFAAQRNVVSVGEGAAVSVIERHVAPLDSAAQSCPVTVLDVARDAEVTWLIVQEGSEGTAHLGQFNAKLAPGAKLTLFIMNAGGKLVRQEVNVSVDGEGADFQLRGVNLLAGDSHTDVTMVLDHLAENTGSVEIIRNVATGRARGVFQGQIRVAKEAQKTDARMACNTLILSDDAEFSAKPELEIFADDVACGHGATVAEIDHDHLFYLMSRGIDEKTARGMLVKAFVAEVIEELDDEALAEALMERLEAWFGSHG